MKNVFLLSTYRFICSTITVVLVHSISITPPVFANEIADSDQENRSGSDKAVEATGNGRDIQIAEGDKPITSAIEFLSLLPEEYKWDEQTLKWSTSKRSAATQWAKENFAGRSFELTDVILSGSSVTKNRETGESEISAYLTAWSSDGRLFMRIDIGGYKLRGHWVDRLMQGPVFLKKAKGHIVKDYAHMGIDTWRGICGEGTLSLGPLDRFALDIEEADFNYCKQEITRLLAENKLLNNSLVKNKKVTELQKVEDEIKAAELIKTIRHDNIKLKQWLLTQEQGKRQNP